MMDRLAALFEQLSLPEISRLLRRTALSALGVGIVALGVSLLLNHPFVGLGACIGLGIGLMNIRLITGSIAHIQPEQAHIKRQLASKTLVRLGVTTVAILGLAIANVTLGLSTAGGVAVFYFLLLIGLVRSLLRHNTNGIAA
jgi:hypothetical protein